MEVAGTKAGTDWQREKQTERSYTIPPNSGEAS